MAAIHQPKPSVQIKGVSHQKKTAHHKKSGHRPNFKSGGSNQRQSTNSMLCHDCGTAGHIRSECPLTKHLSPGGLICWNCHNKGHTTSECTKPKKHHAKAVYTEDEDILGALVEEHAMLIGESGPTTIAFMVDSGASQHIVEHEWMLSNSRSIPEIAFKTVGSKLKANKA
ncbi:hypothetical protein CF327_g7834, partial [Tilletia walkeri]